ncbi:hypothetical protein CLIB1444_24S00430 [[Candida] jaroonii]|uniref:Uncharacterized protein n=1 Tax=[Candida] jaroonii TaxID=467808 RepID=A0ACA9YG62_9ASCO|nr:hypothetical protein CLIB1444_24S00430 [[Candida] jaroonii]
MSQNPVESRDTNDHNQAELNDLIKQLKTQVNPQNNPTINNYFETSLQYLNGIYDKMAKSEDQDKTAHEISEDLVGKLTNWGAELKQKEELKESKDKKDEV